jgi:hypothetical protein
LGLAAFQAAISNGFLYVWLCDRVAAGKVGDAACDFYNAVHGARRKLKTVRCPFEQLLAAAIELAMFAQLLRFEVGVECAPKVLPGTRLLDAASHTGAVFTSG